MVRPKVEIESDTVSTSDESDDTPIDKDPADGYDEDVDNSADSGDIPEYPETLKLHIEYIIKKEVDECLFHRIYGHHSIVLKMVDDETLTTLSDFVDAEKYYQTVDTAITRHLETVVQQLYTEQPRCSSSIMERYFYSFRSYFVAFKLKDEVLMTGLAMFEIGKKTILLDGMRETSHKFLESMNIFVKLFVEALFCVNGVPDCIVANSAEFEMTDNVADETFDCVFETDLLNSIFSSVERKCVLYRNKTAF